MRWLQQLGCACVQGGSHLCRYIGIEQAVALLQDMQMHISKYFFEVLGMCHGNDAVVATHEQVYGDGTAAQGMLQAAAWSQPISITVSP